MDWEQKFKAINALSFEPTLGMRSPGDWFCSARGVEIKKGAMLHAACGNGNSPQSAIEALWELLIHLNADSYIVVDAMSPARKAYRWNGFMWSSVEERVYA